MLEQFPARLSAGRRQPTFSTPSDENGGWTDQEKPCFSAPEKTTAQLDPFWQT
jgi:hypothetical protein